MIKIKYFAYLRDVTRVSEEQIPIPFSTLRGLLEVLCKRYGPGFRKWVLTPEGELCDIAIVLVNGKDVRDGKWLETPLSQGDDICIFPPVAGG
jgi:MoaD family protein